LTSRTLPPWLSLGTLGSAATFAGEATAELRRFYPEFSAPEFFSSMSACWDAIAERRIDVGVLGVERTGQPHHAEEVARRGLHVCASIALPLRCCLYVKKGASTAAVRAIAGHGSIYQCGAYLDAHFPGLPRTMHAQNSVEAAREIADGPGNTALVGSRTVGRVVDGLDLVAEDIDDGAVSNWWAISALPFFETNPTHLLLGGRIGGDGTLGLLSNAMSASGFNLAVVAGFPVNVGVSTYEYLLDFSGQGRLEAVESELAQFAGIRIVGAMSDRAHPPTTSIPGSA
jgi:chorismate mutase/prephenate dehydratase